MKYSDLKLMQDIIEMTQNIGRLKGENKALKEQNAKLHETIGAYMVSGQPADPPGAPADPVEVTPPSVHKALDTIRYAGNNFDTVAVWMQQWAAWGMEPNVWPKPDDKPPASLVEHD